MLRWILRDRFAQLPVHIRKSLLYSLFDGSFAFLHVNLVGGAFLTGFALYLGANAFHIALMTSLPLFAQITQIFSAYIEERYPRRKHLVVICTLISRQICLFFPALLIIFGRSSISITLFLMLITLSGIIAMMGVNVWQSWMADLVPESMWGSYFGIRTTIQNLTITIGILIFSKILDWLQFNQHYTLSYFILFLSASLSAFIALYFLTKVYEPPWKPHALHSLKELISIPFQNINFRKVLFFNALWGFAIGISTAFFAPHMLINLKMSYSKIAIYSITITLTSLVAYPFWGKVLDYSGAKPVLKISTAVVGGLPLLWLLITPQRLLFLWMDGLLTGIFWAAINLALFNLVLAASPRETRSIYLAMYSSITGIATFTGSTLGGWTAHEFANNQFHILGQTIVNFHFLFIASCIGRWCSLFYLGQISIAHEKTFNEMTAYIRTIISGRVFDIKNFFRKNHAL